MSNFSTLLWNVIAPTNFLVWLILCFLVACILPFQGLRKLLALIIFLFILIAAILPTGTNLLTYLENQYACYDTFPKKVDGILVLGGSTKGDIAKTREQIVLNDNAERIHYMVKAHRLFPDAKVTFAGGGKLGAEKELNESNMVRQYLSDIGVSSNRFVYEEKSKNTYENFKYAKEVVDPEPDEVWLLITSAGHMPRAMRVARKFEWDMTPYPVDYETKGTYSVFDGLNVSKNLWDFHFAVREMLSIISYYVSGKMSRNFEESAACP